MTPRTVLVTAPSRLHFGMFSFGQPDTRQFGGIGAMIDKPGLRLRISPAERWEVVGPIADRVQGFVRGVSSRLIQEELPPLRFEVLQSPHDHLGLGVGTQLGLSLAAGLNALFARPPLDADALALLAGRGERSAIGTHGFVHGGFLVDAGKREGELLSPLVARVALPEAWRFVLAIPRVERGRHGVDERQAFRELPPVPCAITKKLQEIVSHKLLPAVVERDCLEFSENLYRFGRLAGACFAGFQHGPFATQRVHRLVDRIRELGISGVGQSSWGPTIFALTADETGAEKLVQSLQGLPEVEGSDLWIARPQNCGALIERE